ncbi:MAG TPA: DUF4430 domain-containing protein [Patescibacteria group bacterium]|nr:DUF4430 domain-containing protein [Patescibacteria group bacterium]
MRAIIFFLQSKGKLIGIIAFLIVAFVAGNVTSFSKNSRPQVLGASVHISPTPTPIQSEPTLTPTPTSVPITVINNIIVPTTAPISTSPTPTSSPIVIVVTPTPAPTAVPTETATPTPTPTPLPQNITIDIDYAGEHAASTYTTPIATGESAWQVVQDAVGLGNLRYTDYGGSLGIFITGFNGVDASTNQYYDFQVNGASSNIGVSSYTVQPNDQLQFVLTNF